MFIESNTKYTEEIKSSQKEFPQGFVSIPSVSMSDYTCSFFIILTPNFSYTGINKRIPAPEDLKRAMFRMSSRGIAKALD
jgi:hypothetical protein